MSIESRRGDDMLTTTAGGRGRCTVTPDTWTAEYGHRAPTWDDRCPQPEAEYVCVLDEVGGMPRERLMRLCTSHAEQVRREPGFAWSRPVAMANQEVDR